MSRLIRNSAIGLGLTIGALGCTQKSEGAPTNPDQHLILEEQEHTDPNAAVKGMGKIACNVVEDNRLFNLPPFSRDDAKKLLERTTGIPNADPDQVALGPVECNKIITPEEIENGLGVRVTGKIPNPNNRPIPVDQICAVIGLLAPAENRLPDPGTRVIVVCPDLNASQSGKQKTESRVF